MTLLDWIIVLFLNGAVIAYGFYLARGTKTSSDWFLGSRALPWWAIGLSMFATNVDNADLVSVTGNTYREGMHIITVYALGSAIGGILAAFWVVPAIYRAGFYTNAEYLEARFGPATRVLSALIQIQYRSTMLGLMIWSIYLLLTGLKIVDPIQAWVLIVAMVILSGIYTAWGGLKSVVWTDALQSLIMMVGGIVIMAAVWNSVGGWTEMKAALDAQGIEQGKAVADLPHAGRYHGDRGDLSPYVIVLGWCIIGSGYWTVNHTQTMRLMGARSLWDMKMAALFGVAISLPIMVACTALGLFGRALYPNLDQPDLLFPLLAREYLEPGLKGLVVAGIVAAAISTFDSMGSALSAIFTRDIYARLFAPNRDDAHYVLAGRIATVVILVLGFLYLPFILLQENMLKAFTTLVPVFVTPLLTMYLAGVFTRAHRRSGVVGLFIGGSYGLVALWDREAPKIGWLPEIEWLAAWFTGPWVALPWAVVITASAMALATLVLGRQADDDELRLTETGWLARSREELPELREHPFRGKLPPWLNPIGYAWLLLIATGYVVFGLFW